MIDKCKNYVPDLLVMFIIISLALTLVILKNLNDKNMVEFVCMVIINVAMIGFFIHQRYIVCKMVKRY